MTVLNSLDLDESKKGCKDQESIQSSTTPDSGYQWEVTNSQKTPQTRAKRSALSQQQTRTKHSKHKTEQKHKRSTKEVPPWNGQ